VFGGPPKNKPAEPDLKVLHAKIGELTLENEWYGRFLSATGYQSGVGI
jgi:hypothetical protein